MAASFVGFIVAASLLMAQHEFTMCLSADDFIVIADSGSKEIYVTNMTTGPDLSSALPLTFTPELTLGAPIGVDFDCVDQKIYLTDKGSGSSDKFVARFNKDGSAVKKILTAIPDGEKPYGIQVDEVNRRFFWIGTSHGSEIGGGVFVTDMSGTMTTRLTSGESPILENIAVDEKEGVIYFTDSRGVRNGVYTVNIDGSGFKKILTIPGKEDFTGVDVDDDKLYWSESAENCIGSANKDGSNPVTFPTEMPDHRPEDIVIYYNNLYFVDKNYDALFRMPKNGSAAPELVSSNDGITDPRGLHIEFTPPCITDALDLTAVSANELVLSWTPDNEICYDKCEADEYQVSFQPYDVQTCSVSDSNVYQEPWQSTSLTTLDNLAQDTFYQMKVTSRNLPADGQDPYEGNSEYIVEPCIADDMAVEQISSNELRVSWSATECECRADEFQVSYTTLDYCNKETTDILPWQTSTSASLPVLSPSSRVDVTVSYRKVYGQTSTEGRLPLTDTIRNITSAPTGPPSDVSVSSVGANDLVMRWSDIPCENSAELIEYQYELESRYGTITGSNTSSVAAFSDLTCGTAYSFRVKATTVGGIGSFSEYSEVQTLTSEEPFASEISATHVPGGTKISWESSVCPPESFDVEYTLTLRDQCEAVPPFTNRLQVPDSAVTLDNLLPFSTYRVVVTGTGSSGTTDTRSTSIVTHESAPSAPPVGLQVVNIEASELEFSWQPPRCGTRHGVIVNYQYEYRYQSMPRIRTTSSTSVKLEGLSSNTDYEFRVAATSSAGTGPYSNAVRVKTHGQCPFDYCLNGGTCDFDEFSGAPSCSCTNGYIGNRCDMKPTLPPAETIPAESDDVIGPGAIAAIATSLVIGVVVTSVAVAVFVYLVCSRSDSAQMLGIAGPAANFGFSDINAGNWILR